MTNGDKVRQMTNIAQRDWMVVIDNDRKAGNVCCNCRHRIREWAGGDCRSRCEVSDEYLGYAQVMENWCRHWAKEKDE